MTCTLDVRNLLSTSDHSAGSVVTGTYYNTAKAYSSTYRYKSREEQTGR